MTDSHLLAYDLIARVKKLKYFEVEFELDDNIELSGKIPFDISIREDVVVCTVLAESYEEAEEKAKGYLFK